MRVIMFPADSGVLVKETIVEQEPLQVVNDVTIEIAGVVGLADQFRVQEQDNSVLAQVHTGIQQVNEDYSVRHVSGAENAANEAVYHSEAGAAGQRSIQAQTHSVLSTVAGAVARESGAKANALELTSEVTQAAVREEMRLNLVINEERKKDVTAALDLESEAVAASVDKDAVNKGPAAMRLG